MLKDKNWLVINNDILKISDYNEIRNDIVEDFKKIYNLSELLNNSADHIFIEDISLAIFNLINQIRDVYKQHNIDEARGTYLDKIMAFYGKYRNKSKPYILKVTLQGEDHKNFREGNTLISKIDDKHNEEYEFIHLKTIKNTENSSEYLIRNTKYIQNLDNDKVKTLKFNSGDGLDLDNREDNLIIMNQKEKESDSEFRNRIKELSYWDNIITEIKKYDEVEDCIILAPNEIVDNLIDVNTIKTGEVAVLIKFNNLYYNLNKEEQDKLQIDIEIEIANFLPLGFNLIDLSNKDSKLIVKHEKTSRKTDFIQQKIIWNEIKPSYGALSFVVQGIEKERVSNLCLDIITFLNKKNIIYNYNKPQLLNDINFLVNVSQNKIWYVQNTTNKKFENIEWILSNENGFNWYNPTKNKVKVNSSTSLNFSELVDSIPNLKFKWDLSSYDFKQNEDGSFTIVLH